MPNDGKLSVFRNSSSALNYPSPNPLLIGSQCGLFISTIVWRLVGRLKTDAKVRSLVLYGTRSAT